MQNKIKNLIPAIGNEEICNADENADLNLEIHSWQIWRNRKKNSRSYNTIDIFYVAKLLYKAYYLVNSTSRRLLLPL